MVFQHVYQVPETQVPKSTYNRQKVNVIGGYAMLTWIQPSRLNSAAKRTQWSLGSDLSLYCKLLSEQIKTQKSWLQILSLNNQRASPHHSLETYEETMCEWNFIKLNVFLQWLNFCRSSLKNFFFFLGERVVLNNRTAELEMNRQESVWFHGSQYSSCANSLTLLRPVCLTENNNQTDGYWSRNHHISPTAKNPSIALVPILS